MKFRLDVQVVAFDKETGIEELVVHGRALAATSAHLLREVGAKVDEWEDSL